MAPSDRALLRKWQRTRDADTFLEIVSRHSAMVYATCHRILRNTADAEDVTQECFTELVRSDVSVERSLGGWLHAMATHRSLNRIRADKRREYREARFAQQNSVPTQSTWEDVQGHLDEAIASLPDELREPVTRRFLYGETHDSIARALGVSRSTVLRRLREGTTEIRRLLECRGIVATLVGLTILMSANMAEAAPASLVAVLGRLALASSAGKAVAETTPVAWAAKVLGGVVVMKKIVVVLVVVVLAVAGFVVLSNRGEPDVTPVTQQSSWDKPEVDRSGDRGPALVVDGNVAAETEEPVGLDAAGAPPGGVVSGHVYDVQTREGVAGVVVFAYHEGGELPGRASAPSDDAGSYRIEALPPGDYLIHQRGNAPYLDHFLYWHPRDKDLPPERTAKQVKLKENEMIESIDLLLKKGLQVTGYVVDWEHNPVVAVEVSADGEWAENAVYTAKTGEKGAFAFKPLEPTNALILEAEKKGFSGFARVGPFSLQDDREGIEIVMTRTHSIRGVVVDKERKPVAGVQVSSRPLDEAKGRGGKSELTDRKGRFEITGVMPGAHRLTPLRSRPDDQGYFTELLGAIKVTVPSDRDLTGVQLVLEDAGAALRGRVTDLSGRPLGSATVDFDAHIFRSTVETGTDGRFEMTHVPTCAGMLSVSHDGYFSQKIPDVLADGTPVTVTLAPFSGLEIQVVKDTTGQPVTEYELAWVKGLRDEIGFSSALSFQRVCDKTGRFEIRNVESANVTVIARAPGFVPAHKGVALGERNPTTRVQLRLREGGTVRGEVVNAGGDPVSSALVSVGLPPIEEDRPGVVLTQTTDDGRFELCTVPLNTTAVCAQHSVYGFGCSPLASAARHGQEIRIVLSEPARVVGVVTEGGAPVRGATVQVAKLLDAEVDAPLTTSTDSNGSYTFPALPAGDVVLTARCPGERRHLIQSTVAAPGKTTTVNLNFAAKAGNIEGTVTLNGAPVVKACVDVVATTVSGQEYFSCTTDASGCYHIDDVPAGAAQMRVSTIERDPLDFGTFVVEIREGEVTRQDIEASL